jgi:exodeoxyribonuclease V beta subunit
LAEEEARAEESRLLYVALTRARHHLIVWWTEHHKGIENAKLTELLSRNGRSPQQLAAASGGTIEVSAVEDEPSHDRYSRRTQAPIPLEVARFVRPIDHTWRRASFSSLVAQQPASPSEELEEDLLRADEGEPAEEEEEVAVGSVSVSRSPLAEMPRGARFGTLVHAIMERLPFHASDLDAAIASLLASHTRTTAWDFDTEAFVNGISDAVNTPLGPDPAAPALADLAPGDLLRELEFELPVRESGSPVTPADIARVMDRFLPADDRYRPYLDDLARSPATAFRGYLAGAIDLVARMPDGRFVVMDYKSNAVAPDGGDPYGPESLAAEMVRHRYVLQATLYQVALHRYLEWRLAGYQPTQHLGGSVYLFVRGMVGRDTPVIAGERAGVARWLPPPPMIVALSKLLVGVSS